MRAVGDYDVDRLQVQGLRGPSRAILIARELSGGFGLPNHMPHGGFDGKGELVGAGKK